MHRSSNSVQGRKPSTGDCTVDVWPGVLAALRRVNFTNYSTFLREGVLFSDLEYTGVDYPADTVATGQRWAPMTAVFHLD